ncbi:MAG: divergent PAP2 family protein [Alphaproteobacteria bacterium]
MQNFTLLNTGFEAILSGTIATLLAQILKFLINAIKTKEFNYEHLFTTGGMPSSHSSGVCALTTSVGLIGGFNSLMFAVSFGYAVVIMHDAAGLRRDSGQMAKCLNEMMKEFYKSDIKTKSKQLKELLGHTPKEVFWGAILGIVIALGLHHILLG